MHSEQIDKIIPALRKAQAMLKPVAKDADNPYFSSKYAPLEACWEEAQRVLSANSLTVNHRTRVDAQHGTVIICTLWHDSGQWMSGEMPLLSSKENPQAQGSAFTYARRYTLEGMVGLTRTEDDDGNAASKPAAAKAKEPELPPPPKVEEPVEDDIPDALCGILDFAKLHSIPDTYISTLLTKKYSNIITDETINQLWVDMEAVEMELKGKKVTAALLKEIFRRRLNATVSNNQSTDSTSASAGTEASSASSEA